MAGSVLIKMKEFIKNNWLTITLALATFILAVGTVVIISRLKELGTQPVAPNVPQNQPEATNNNRCTSQRGGCYLTFSVPTPTPTPSVECAKISCQADSDCAAYPYKVCADLPGDNLGKVCLINPNWEDGCTPPKSTPTPTLTPTPISSLTPTPTPTPACGEKLCQTEADCQDLPYKQCVNIGSDNTSQKKCVINGDWFDGCTPPGPTSTPTPTPTSSPTSTPTPTSKVAKLPAAGSSTTVLMTAGSFILATIGLALLF